MLELLRPLLSVVQRLDVQKTNVIKDLQYYADNLAECGLADLMLPDVPTNVAQYVKKNVSQP